MIKNISAIILAGGASKRFNGNTKSNIVIGGRTIISRMTNTLKELFDEIVIVTNMPEEFAGQQNYKIISDYFLKTGPLGGIHAAIKASSKEALFVFAGDMPLIDRGLIIRQIDYYNLHKCDILLPRFNKFIEPLHAIYCTSILKTLEDYLAAGHNYAVREFFKMVNICYLQLEASDAVRKAFMNINSPSDLPAAEKIAGSC